MKKICLGFLGFGNIGSGTYRILEAQKADIAHRYGLEFAVKKMLVRDKTKKRRIEVAEGVLTEDPSEVLDDPEISIIVEFMGGEQPARDYLLRALENGKSVVTANKEVVSKCWPDLESAAKKSGSGLFFEASVAGGIPIIKTLNDSMQGNRIDKIMGIINGTTNYILTSMADQGIDYAEALAKAQELGLAEPDPTNDVMAYDAAFKLSILTSLAFHTHIPVDYITREGITNITASDIALGSELGYTLKLLAIGKRGGPVTSAKVQARVVPTFIPVGHPLASVKGAFNAVFIHGSAVDDIMLYGRGAGDLPTGSAIVSDIVAAANGVRYYNTFENKPQPAESVRFDDDYVSEFFVSTEVKDEPGVMGKIASVFGKWGVSLRSVIQKGEPAELVPVIYVTHPAHINALNSAIKEIETLPEVKRVKNVIHVESEI